MEPDVLLAQPNEVGDEQCSASQQNDRERDLGTHQNFSEMLLLRASACSASPFFCPLKQVGAGTLPGWIDSHGETGQDGQGDGKAEDGKGKLNPRGGVEWKKVRRPLWHDRNDLPCEECACDSGNHADEQTLENEKTHHAKARCSQCHAQCDFTAASAEPDEEQIGDIAARDQQHECDGG